MLVMRTFWIVFAAVAIVTNSASAEDAQAPIHEWVINRDYLEGSTIRSTRGGLKASTPAPFENGEKLLFEGEQRLVGEAVTAKLLPKKTLTVEVQARVDQYQAWGGLFSFMQDNGAFEKGWLLGYKDDRFIWQISNGPKLITISSKDPIKKEAWTHVTGTYDGEEMVLYVNGKPVASSREARGDIEYPPTAFYTIGSYLDDDETFPLKGQIAFARLYDVALPAAAVFKSAARSAGSRPASETKPELPFAVRPHSKFIRPGVARIRWESNAAGKGSLAYGTTRDLGTVVPATLKNGIHEVVLEGLKPHTTYVYRIAIDGKPKRMLSRNYELDTDFDYTTLRPAKENATNNPSGDAEARAERLVESAGQRNGMTLVTNLKDGSLLRALANKSDARIVGVSDDADLIGNLRKAFYKEGIYGHRVTLRHVPNDQSKNGSVEWPFTPCSVNLVTSEAANEIVPPNAATAELLVAGSGKLAVFKSGAQTTKGLVDKWKALGLEQTSERPTTQDGLLVFMRPPLKGAADWSHQYGTVNNTTSTTEQLGGARGTEDLAVQWIGRPGGDFGIDRNPRMPAPLAVNGRLFHQGMNRLVALDQYNGSVAWALEIPDLRRVNIPRDSSNWCAETNRLYLAVRNRAWVVDDKGDVLGTLQIPGQRATTHDWGWIATDPNQLFGSTVPTGGYYSAFWGKKMWFDEKEGEGTHPVCSDGLFCYGTKADASDPPSDDQADLAKLQWEYRRGTIVNPTITMDSNHVYFVENPKLQAGGTVSDPALWENVVLVALNRKTGERVWERPVTGDPYVRGVSSYYLLAHEKRILLVASNKKYHIYAFDPKNGDLVWNDSRKWFDDHHSGHIQRPVVVEDKLYLQPNGFDVLTGKHLTSNMGKREGCHTYVGAGSALIFRGTARQISMWDPLSETTTAFKRLRPSCWLSVIPAGGMLLVPEGGGGCSCGNWIETSLGMIPRSHLEMGTQK